MSREEFVLKYLIASRQMGGETLRNNSRATGIVLQANELYDIATSETRKYVDSKCVSTPRRGGFDA